MSQPYLSSLFCDDVRHEVGSKISLMGIYGAYLLVESLPAILPKLCVHFSLILPEAETLVHQLTVKLMINNEIRESVRFEDIKLSIPHDRGQSSFTGGFEMSAITFEDNSKLELVAELMLDEQSGSIRLPGSILLVMTQDEFKRSRQSV